LHDIVYPNATRSSMGTECVYSWFRARLQNGALHVPKNGLARTPQGSVA
jgi:hypothetical protein